MIYGFNDFKLSSLEVYYYQTFKFVFLGKTNLKMIVLKTQIIFALYFLRG